MAFFDKATGEGGAWKPTHNETTGEPDACFMCKGTENPPEYRPSPCGCFAVCKKCAMKCATGGKCRLCKEFFTHLTSRPINVAAIAAAKSSATAIAGDEDDDDFVEGAEGEEEEADDPSKHPAGGR